MYARSAPTSAHYAIWPQNYNKYLIYTRIYAKKVPFICKKVPTGTFFTMVNLLV